jgi:nitronate monooxygenase
VLLAPMAGACPVALSVAVANAGGMGAMGALLSGPQEIAAWADAFRQESSGSFQLNTWIPDPLPPRDPAAEEKLRRFLASWGPEVPPYAADVKPKDLDAQCAAFLAAKPAPCLRSWGYFRLSSCTPSRQAASLGLRPLRPPWRRSIVRRRGQMQL